MTQERRDSPGAGVRRWPGGHVLRLDLRSLALTRIFYGFLLLCDTSVRWVDLGAFYTDYGVLPRTDLLKLGWNASWFSIHMASGDPGWLHLLFLLQWLAAAALLVGYRTRLATWVSWVLLVSLHSRNPIILNGGDIYLRVILFWMLFLPWGHRWSWDARKGQGESYPGMPCLKDNQIFSLAGLGLTLQFASIYWFAALPKTDPSWTATYTATRLTLQLDQFLTPAGYFFRDHFGGLLGILTVAVLTWEAYGPFLFFFPLDRGQTRTLGVFGFMALHLGFGTMLELGFFAWIGFLSPVVMLPAWFWERPGRRLAQWADRHWGVGPAIEKEGFLAGLREGFFLFITLYCLAWNLTNERVGPRWMWLTPRTNWFGHAVRLDQRWNMFSPGPLTEDGWYIIEGKFKHGAVLDLFRGGKEVRWDKPADVANSYKNERWRKYMMNLWMADFEPYRLPFGQYLSRKWNSRGRGPDELTSFEIIFMLEITNPDGSERAPEKKVVWRHWCFDPPPEAKTVTK